jgi:hypothetical protein
MLKIFVRKEVRKMNDYISRDNVLRKFIEGDGHDDDRFTEGYNFAVQEHREEVMKIPAADVQPVKHGKWKHVAGLNSKCSVCSHYFPVTEFDSRPFDINYCPNCGARMDGETE